MIGTIYALTTPEGEIRYCGKTVKPPSHRLHGHKDAAYRNRARHVSNWLRSIYDAGQSPKLMVCEEIDLTGLDRAQQMLKLNDAERRWIMQLRALGFRLTNATDGGDGRHGHKASDETRRKQSAALTGKKFSAERCARMSEAALKIPKETYKSGPEHPRYGKPQEWRDPESRAAKIKATWARRDQPRKTSGAGNGKSKITDAIARDLFTAVGTLDEIAERFSVHRQVVWSVKSRKTWRDATGIGEA